MDNYMQLDFPEISLKYIRNSYFTSICHCIILFFSPFTLCSTFEPYAFLTRCYLPVITNDSSNLGGTQYCTFDKDIITYTIKQSTKRSQKEREVTNEKNSRVQRKPVRKKKIKTDIK